MSTTRWRCYNRSTQDPNKIPPQLKGNPHFAFGFISCPFIPFFFLLLTFPFDVFCSTCCRFST